MLNDSILRDIIELSLDLPLPWWPLAPGWWGVLGVIVLGLIWLIWQIISWVLKNSYRLHALKQIRLAKARGTTILLGELPYILKMTALHAYPRKKVASLSGEPWLIFLDSCCKNTFFRSDTGRLILAIAYQPVEQWQINPDQTIKLTNLTRHWIRAHKADNKC
ncbi:DUF4381 domain-containing protein [bacterium]|nr:DUF4381 domain-containing protein [bacterium]